MTEFFQGDRIIRINTESWMVGALRPAPKSPVYKRSVVIDGKKTSVTLGDSVWFSLKEMADSRNVSVSMLVREIKINSERSKLSSAIREFVFNS